MHTNAHAMEGSSAHELLQGCVDLQRVREIASTRRIHAVQAEAAHETEECVLGR